jgi:pimeloyl-ACP methyl ester carboxylesterase
MEYASFGRGVNLLLVHGALGGYDQGITIASLLGLSGVRFLAVSRPGYLRTPLEVGRTYEQQANAFVALLDALQVPQAVLMGVSAGGPSSMLFAQNHPRRCAGLILLSAVTKQIPVFELKLTPQLRLALSAGADFAGWLAMGLMHRSPRLMTKGMLTRSDRKLLNDPLKRAAFLRLVDTFVPFAPRRAGTENDGQQIDSLAEIPPQNIRTPTLIIHGTADRLVPYTHATTAAAAIPGAKVVSFDGGHLAGTLHGPAIRAAIKDFVAGLQVETNK